MAPGRIDIHITFLYILDARALCSLALWRLKRARAAAGFAPETRRGLVRARAPDRLDGWKEKRRAARAKEMKHGKKHKERNARDALRVRYACI